MGLFTPAVRRLVALFYHCFDHIVIHGYLTGCVTARLVGILVITKDTLSQRTDGYQEARRAEKGVRKDAYEFGRPTAHDIPESSAPASSRKHRGKLSPSSIRSRAAIMLNLAAR
jgi:hypothetical protein